MKTVAGKLNLQETAADTVASVALFGASVEAFRRRLGMHKPQSLCGARSHCYASGSGSLLFPGSLRRHNNWQRPSSSKGVTMSKYNRPLLRWCRRATFINQGDPTGFRTRSSPELGLRTEERHRGFMFAIGEEAKLVHLYCDSKSLINMRLGSRLSEPIKGNNFCSLIRRLSYCEAP